MREHGYLCPGWYREAHYSEDLTADHVTPVGAGGSEWGELRVLCRSCNSRRPKRPVAPLPAAVSFPSVL